MNAVCVPSLSSAWSVARVFAFALLAHAPLASAQAAARPSTVLYSTQGAPTGSPLDSLIQTALEDLGVVEIVSRPGMDLGAVQLALDCVAETIRCLRAATDQSHADILIAPTLQHTPSELVLSVLRFDARGSGKMRRVLRRQSGQAVSSALLDQLPNMMRELFDLPPAPKPAAAPQPAPVAEAPVVAPPPEAPAAPIRLPEGPMEPPESRWRVPVAPLILGGAGVLALGGGIVAGALMQSKQSQYQRLKIETTQDAKLASDLRSTGRTDAVVADVLFGVGGAAIIASGIWLLVDHARAAGQDSEITTTLQPVLGAREVGLVLTHRGDAL